MFDQYRKTILAGAVALTCGLTAASTFAAGFQPAQPAGKLGAVVVDPYGNAPLTALVELDSHIISDVKVTVHGKGEKGVPVTYTVGKESLETYDGIPIFGLYQKFANNVTVEYKENGKAMKDDYVVQTSAIVNHYMDNRSISDLQQTKVIKVAPGFEDRLYLVNTHTFTPQGAEFHWHGEKDKNAGILDAGPAGGVIAAINPKNIVLKLIGCIAAFYGSIMGIKFSIKLNGIHHAVHNADPDSLFGVQGCSTDPTFPFNLPLAEWAPEWFKPTGDCGYDAPIVPDGVTLSSVQQWFVDLYQQSEGWYLLPPWHFMNMAQACMLAFGLCLILLLVMSGAWALKLARGK
ncbi:protein-disulfide oxidoreductase DsbI [Salmonella enterica]|nr:protein-disulfide oxidoreductase DsbI [Salmonella enterica]